eukprot:s306_g8.t1
MHGTTTEDFAAAASTPISYISWNAAGATQWHLPPSVFHRSVGEFRKAAEDANFFCVDKTVREVTIRA